MKRRRVEERREEDVHEAEGEEGQEAPQNGEGSAEEVRVPKTPPDPGKPTARERAEHMVLHYPYRSWCRHCARGRGCSRHHKRRSAEDREFSKGRVPTLSFDHCFLGAEGDEDGTTVAASGNPFLIMYDADSETIYAIPVATKAVTQWLVVCVHALIEELGYGQVKVAVKCDQAPELQSLRSRLGALRSAPTVPIDVPVKESKMIGAVERAVRSWEGQFRTIRDHLESEMAAQNFEVPVMHPIWTWCAWWSATVLNRFAIRDNGRTSYEMVTGHKTKVPVVGFGEHILWRYPRSRNPSGKLISEWHDGIFLGLTGTSSEVYVGTADGVYRANDIRRHGEHPYAADLVESFQTSLQQYVDPETVEPPVAFAPTEPQSRTPAPADAQGEEPVSRRMRLVPADFDAHGFTPGCAGCNALRAKAALSGLVGR